jgi:hypothetical protein
MTSCVGRFIVFVALLLALPRGASAQPTTEPSPDAAPADLVAEDAPVEPSDGADVTTAEAVAASAEPAEEDAVVEIEPMPEPTSALSDLLENVAIHGFGTYGAGWTRVPRNQSNQYLYGDRNGDFGHVNFSMRELVQPLPELRFYAGQSFSVDGGEFKVELDLAGAQWTPNRWFSLRAGRILSPFGVYTEVYRVGTLRPFGALPTSIYANAGFITQSYDGLELAFSLETESGWRARIAVVGGRAEIDQDGAIARVVEANIAYPAGAIHSKVVMDLMMGAQVVLDTPIDGLGFAYGVAGSTRPYTDLLGNSTIEQNWNNVVMIGSAYYLGDDLEVRGEVAYRFNRDRDATGATARTLQKNYGVYLEAAYRVHEHVQVGVRFERMSQQLANTDTLLFRRDPGTGTIVGDYDSIQYSNDIGGVISYWWNRDFVMKLEYHFIDGNRFAHPDEAALYQMTLEGRPLARQTHFVGFTSAFSF